MSQGEGFAFAGTEEERFLPPDVIIEVIQMVGGIIGKYERPVESTLWHYTTASAIKNMLETGRMWATDADYLNDTSELRRVSDRLVEVAAERNRRDRTRHSAEVLDFAEFEVKNMRTTYVVSFSTLPNNLNQWRSYGDEGAGYSLLFDLDKVGGAVDVAGGEPHMVLPVRCAYLSDDEVLKKTELLVDAAITAQERGGRHASLRSEMILQLGIAMSGPAFKTPEFEHEQEVRLVILAHPRHLNVDAARDDAQKLPERKVRTRGGLFIPYMDVDLAAAFSGVWAGPKHRSDEYRVLYGLKSLMMTAERPDLTLGVSKHPYRP